MKEDIEELRANVERTEMAGLTFIATRAACARAALDYIAQLEQTSRAQRTNEWESAAPVGREFAAAGQAGLANLTRYEPNFRDGEEGMEVCATGDYFVVSDVEALLAPVAADTEQARPVEPGALAASIAEMEAWLETDGCEPLTVSQGESVGLILHELKRLRAVCPECKGSGMADSGGTHPWGEPALIRCGCTPLATPADAGAGQNDEQLRETDGYKLGWMEGMQEGAELATGGEKTAADVEAEFADLLPGSYYMDPPDGGSPSVLEQVSRMAEDAAQWRAHIASLGQSPAPVTATDLLNELHRLFRTREWTDREGDWDDALVAVCEEIAKRIQVARGAVSAAPVTAEPADLSASSLLKLWQRANAAATDTMPAPFQFAKLLLANAPAPADRDAIRDQALEEAAKACEARITKSESDHYAPYNAEDMACADAIRALKSMERAADAAETSDAKGGE